MIIIIIIVIIVIVLIVSSQSRSTDAPTDMCFSFQHVTRSGDPTPPGIPDSY